jgi:hypothetical protein
MSVTVNVSVTLRRLGQERVLLQVVEAITVDFVVDRPAPRANTALVRYAMTRLKRFDNPDVSLINPWGQFQFRCPSGHQLQNYLLNV